MWSGWCKNCGIAFLKTLLMFASTLNQNFTVVFIMVLRFQFAPPHASCLLEDYLYFLYFKSYHPNQQWFSYCQHLYYTQLIISIYSLVNVETMLKKTNQFEKYMTQRFSTVDVTITTFNKSVTSILSCHFFLFILFSSNVTVLKISSTLNPTTCPY